MFLKHSLIILINMLLKIYETVITFNTMDIK